MNTRIMLLAKFLLLIPTLTGCETIFEADGLVADVAGEPLTAVTVSMVVDNDIHMSVTTDSTGTFKVSSSLVGCPFGCPEAEVVFELDRYVAQRHEPSHAMLISMQRHTP